MKTRNPKFEIGNKHQIKLPIGKIQKSESKAGWFKKFLFLVI